MPGPIYDWDDLRDRYVTSTTTTLADLARLPNSPAESTIRRRAAEHGWTRQRNEHRNKVATRAREIVAVDQAEIVARHASIARSLQAKALARLRALDPMELGPRDLLAYIKEAADIERLALALNGTDGNLTDQFDAIADALRDPVEPDHTVN